MRLEPTYQVATPSIYPATVASKRFHSAARRLHNAEQTSPVETKNWILVRQINSHFH